MILLSNTNLGNVQDQIRQNALQSFEFFANSVLSHGLPEDLCAAVQDVVEDRESGVMLTNRPRAVAMSLHGWLTSQGITVVTSTELPQSDVLQWLGLDVKNEVRSEGVMLEVLKDAVRITWL